MLGAHGDEESVQEPKMRGAYENNAQNCSIEISKGKYTSVKQCLGDRLKHFDFLVLGILDYIVLPR